VLTRHVSRQLARYCDQQVTAAEAARIEAHLAACERCRRERDEIRFAAGLVRQLAVVAAPSSVWHAIDAGLDARVPTPRLGSAHARRWLLEPALALAWVLAIVAAGAGAWWVANRPTVRPWEVATLDVAGRPVAAPQAESRTARKAEGDVVETDAASRARITVGSLGTVDLDPATRVRLGAVRGDEYRMALARGTISARISAAPRLFIVDTPASTVVDLGCAYTVNVDEAGAGDLRVTEGWASLEWKGRESLVPAGAACRIRPSVGPGTPYFEDAPAALRDALVEFDFAAGGSPALSVVLAESRVRDTLTLWHLLSRVDASERARVIDRIAELTPLPDTVSRDRALQLDAETLTHWREELAWTW
jgi:hypothetical protein